MADKSGYIGNNPGDTSVVVARQVHEPTGIQTTFTFSAGYKVGYIDVYVNGSKLVSNGTDYTATDGNTVGLTTYATSGDIVELVAYKAFNAATVENAPGNLFVGNNLTVTGITTLNNDVYTTADLILGGSVTGDGSLLTGIAVTDVVHTRELTVSGVSTFTGNAEFTGSISVGGTVTHEDVTNVDSVGIVTGGLGLRATAGGLQVTAGVSTLSGTATVADGVRVSNGGLQVVGVYTGFKASGVSTFAGGDILIDGSAVGVTSVTWDASADSLIFKDKSYLKFGDGSDMSVYHDGSNAMIDNNTGNLNIQTGGTLYLTNASGGEVYAQFSENGASQLRYDNSTKLETTSIGVQLTENALITNTTGISTLTLGKGAALADGCCQIQTVNTGADTDQLGLDFLVHPSTFGTAAPVSAMKVWHDGAFVFDNAALIEKCYINATAWSTNGDINLDNGVVQYNTSNLAGTNNTLNITSSVGINTQMGTGDVISVTCISTQNANTAYVNNITVDHAAVTENWIGGSAPTDGGSSGVDIYAFSIIKTASATYTVIANQNKTS